MKLLLTTAALGILLFSPDIAMACSCAGTPSVCGAFASAEAVFVPQVDKFVKAYKDIETNRVQLEVMPDHHDLELLFTAPVCAKKKEERE